jgi:hypothetical protein
VAGSRSSLKKAPAGLCPALFFFPHADKALVFCGYRRVSSAHLAPDRGCAGYFRFGPQDVWSLFHTCAFDFSVWELWGALLHGGRLVVAPYEVSRSPSSCWTCSGRKG